MLVMAVGGECCNVDCWCERDCVIQLHLGKIEKDGSV